LANPASQLGKIVLGAGTTGLLTVLINGKAAFNPSDKPQFIAARMLAIFLRPSVVKCSLLLINSQICLKSSKSARFLVINGYLSK